MAWLMFILCAYPWIVVLKKLFQCNWKYAWREKSTLSWKSWTAMRSSFAIHMLSQRQHAYLFNYQKLHYGKKYLRYRSTVRIHPSYMVDNGFLRNISFLRVHRTFLMHSWLMALWMRVYSLWNVNAAANYYLHWLQVVWFKYEKPNSEEFNQQFKCLILAVQNEKIIWWITSLDSVLCLLKHFSHWHKLAPRVRH